MWTANCPREPREHTVLSGAHSLKELCACGECEHERDIAPGEKMRDVPFRVLCRWTTAREKQAIADRPKLGILDGYAAWPLRGMVPEP